MKYDLIARAAQLLRRGGRHRRWRRAVSGLAAVVVFVTSYMLILPALTLEQDTICGLEEHTHTDACYEQRLVCTLEESEPVYEDRQVLTCTLPEGEGHTHTDGCCGLTCALEESEGHTHTEACYTAVSELTCTLAESEGHAHSDSCYGEDGSLICTLEESEGHTHADGCYTTVSQLTCTQEESEGHTHDDGCYGLICGQEECEAHTHTDACYTTQQVQVSGHVHTEACYEQALICDLPEHTHTGECFTQVELPEVEVPMDGFLCGLEEHTHIDECYDPESGELICTLTEHTHGESCLPEEECEYICGITAHVHTDPCYDPESGELICTLTEHTHGESCLPVEGTGAAVFLGEGRFQYEDDRMSLTVHLVGGEELENLALQVVPLDEDSEAYQTLAGHAGSQGGTELYDLLAFEYAFTQDGAPLDVSAYEITSEVTLKSTVMAAPAAQAMQDAEEAVDESEVGVYLSVFQYDQETVGEPIEEEPIEEEPVEEQPAGEEPSREPLEEAGAEEEPAVQPMMRMARMSLASVDTGAGAEAGAEAGADTGDGTEAGTDTGAVSDGVTQLAAQFHQADQAAGAKTLTFTMKGGTQVALATAFNANPEFTVQYWANVAMVNPNGDGYKLDVIDTRGNGDGKGGNIPENGNTSPPLTHLALDDNGKIIEKDELMEVYSSKKFTFLKYPGLTYVNRLKDNKGYTLKELWVLKAGKNPDSTNRDDWKTYDPNSVTFTNNPDSEDGNAILITNNTVIRLVFGQNPGTYTNDVNLFDYDIAETMGTDSNWDTPHYGINNEGQYTVVGDARYAFGNANAGVKYGWDLWKGNNLNAYNYNGYAGCTFGLVTGIADDGDVEFADGISAPNYLFTTDERTGKRVGTANLTFNRVGDTYTLTSVSGNMDGTPISVDNLDKFKFITYAFGTKIPIYSNNFWPMDNTQIKIPNFGGDNRPEFWGFIMDKGVKVEGTGSLPASDDKEDHNSYFGMKYAVSFNLTADYVGPLDYYFFGDDDMWVFLTGEDGEDTLVCDIGGVHSSVGQYVNLWDYIDKDDPNRQTETYTLTFFYTERGASGSTCYMRFTLPSVTSATVDQESGDLMVSKEVDGVEGEVYSQEFEFRLELSGPGAENLYPTFIRYDESGMVVGEGTIGEGGTFTLQDGQYIVISNLPVGIDYTVTEKSYDGFTTTVNGKPSLVAAGKIDKDGETFTVAYINSTGPRLPSTGGMGVVPYFTLGSLMTIGGGLLLIRRRWKGSHAAR